jgi:hypothetical protein
VQPRSHWQRAWKVEALVKAAPELLRYLAERLVSQRKIQDQIGAHCSAIP